MNTKVIIYYLLLAIMLFSGCKRRINICHFYSSDLLKNFREKLIISDFDSVNGTISQITDKIALDHRFGEYSFFNNGQLKSYKFFANEKAYTYNEEYDLNGVFKKNNGSALVYKKIREINNDSALFSLYFFSLNKIFEPIKIIINNNSIIQADLQSDTTFTNLKNYSFGLNTSGLSDIEIFVYVKYRTYCPENNIELIDTISLKRNAPDLK